jgi:NAD(P)H-dependent FMN reductase
MNPQLSIALLYGSVRPGRLCDTVARWAGAEIDRHAGLRWRAVDPLQLRKPNAGFDDETLRGELQRADAFVVVTPEYNHGYPAAIKELIDADVQGWVAKPVSFVSYGGLSGGLRAVEQLRQVFAELHATTVRDGVSFVNAWDQFDEHGQLRNPEPARKAMAMMLDRLRWWALALREARSSRPYVVTL